MLPSIQSIKDNYVTFSDGKFQHFDAIVLATGYRSAVKKWLKVMIALPVLHFPPSLTTLEHLITSERWTWLQGDDYLLGEDGMAKQMFPGHWKGKNRLYCAGLARRGIYGSGEDAQSIANDIASDYQSGK